MPDRTKIATCNYCGTRAMLDLRGKSRHELACSACGAPLHLMKPLRADRNTARPQQPVHSPRNGPRNGRPAWYDDDDDDDDDDRRDHRRAAPPWQKPRKRREKSLFARIWDEIEDIID